MGKTNPLPGSNATIALTLGFLIAVSQPGPPACECVKRIAGPVLPNNGNRQPLAAVFGLGQRLSRRYFDQCQGSRVSIWRIGWSAMRSRTSAR